MKWQSANGELTFTLDHIADAAAAAGDPHIRPPRLKIGHGDPRFDDGVPDHDPFVLLGDGEPAIGSVRNIRLANDGSMLVGDYVDVPVWLAEAMPTAFPSRSIEGAWSMVEGAAGEPRGTWDVVTPGGKKYTFVLTACALLGVVGPAITSLDDLRLWLTTGDGLVVAGAPPVEGAVPVDAATVDGVTVVPKMSADVEQVIDAFCAEINELSPQDPQYWWWPIGLETDSGKLICDDEEGGLQAVPYTTDEDTNVTFGEPYRVIKRYEAAPEPAEMAAVLLHGKPDVIFRSPAETPLASRHAGRKKDPKAGGSKASAPIPGMDFSTLSPDARKRLAVSLSLGEEATDEEITEALEADTGDGGDGGSGDGDPAAGGAPAAGDPADPADPQVPADAATVSVDKATYDRLIAGAEAGARAEAKQIADHRTGVLDAAIAAGKIMPSSREAWAAKLSAAPEATEAEIEKLAPGLVPVLQAGHSIEPAEAGGAVNGITPAEATRQLFPNLQTMDLKETA